LNYISRPAWQSAERYSHGFALQVSVGRQFSHRLGARLDAFVAHFGVELPPRLALCAFSCTSVSGTVGLASFTASGVLNVDPPGSGLRMYAIAGAGTYYFYQHPSAGGAVRPGLAVGGGFTLKVRGRSQVFVEARYHDILGAPSQPTWLVPLTFGIRF
jgi:hypothetical protein